MLILKIVWRTFFLYIHHWFIKIKNELPIAFDLANETLITHFYILLTFGFLTTVINYKVVPEIENESSNDKLIFWKTLYLYSFYLKRLSGTLVWRNGLIRYKTISRAPVRLSSETWFTWNFKVFYFLSRSIFHLRRNWKQNSITPANFIHMLNLSDSQIIAKILGNPITKSLVCRVSLGIVNVVLDHISLQTIYQTIYF